MIALFNEFKSAKNKDKRKTYQTTFDQKEKYHVKRKWKEKMNQLQKHILFFDFLENHYVSKNASKNSLNMVKKSDFVKEDKTIVQSSHPPLNTIIINCKETEINASPFKFAELIDTNNPISNETKKIIEQNNFVNNSLHIIGQQLDRIEEKVGKPTSSEPEKSLIDLPSQRKKLSLKTPQANTIEKVEQMLSDLRVKTEQGTSTSTACAISRKEKETVFEENTDSDSSSSASNKTVSELLEIKRFVGKPNPISFTKTGIQNLLLLTCSLKKEFSKLSFLFLLINSMNEILMVYLNKKLLIKWVTCLWLLMLILPIIILTMLRLLIFLLLVFLELFVGGGKNISLKNLEKSIKKAVKKDDNGLPIFDESIGRGILDGVNTLIYTIIKHFVGTPNISS